jgi:cytochrome c oxidase cbb3-type subunit 4
MDINDLRVVTTVLAFVAFMGIVAWAYGRGRKGKFDDAARLPFSREPGEDLMTIRGTEDAR